MTTQNLVEVRVARLPKLPRLTNYNVEYTTVDAAKVGHVAQTANAWTVRADHGGCVPRTHWGRFNHTPRDVGETETVCVITAPDGRVAVWYGRALAFAVTLEIAAHSALVDDCPRDEIDLRAGAARIFGARQTLGGSRDVTPLAMTACRVLHAGVFNDGVSERDRLLAEVYGVLDMKRPATKTLTSASDDALAAASAMILVGDVDGAVALLKSRNAKRVAK